MKLHPAFSLLLFLSASKADDRVALAAADIGPKYRLEGNWGPLETVVTLEGKVVILQKPQNPDWLHLKVDKVNGKAVKPTVVEIGNCEEVEIGSIVVLRAVEKAEFVKIGIDAIGSSPNRDHAGQVYCLLRTVAESVVSVARPTDKGVPDDEHEHVKPVDDEKR